MPVIFQHLNMRRLLPWLGLLVLAAAGSSWAVHPHADGAGTHVSEADYFGELPVVLSVSRLSQPLNEAPAAVTVLDAEFIRASGARDLADLLRYVPGFQVNQGDLGSPLAVYHGMTDQEPKRLQVLIDGRSQYSPMFVGAVNWNAIAVQLEDIERIEVVRGSNSAAYGSNAFLGIVNVITRHAAQTKGVVASVSNGNQGVKDRYARVGGALGPGYFRLSAEQRADEGLRSVFDSREIRRAHLRADLPLTLQDSLEVSLGRTEVVQGDDASPPFTPDRLVELHKTHVQAIWRRQLEAGSEIVVRAAHTDERSLDYVLLVAPPFSSPNDYNFDTWRDEVEGQYATEFTWGRLVAGGGFRGDAVRSTQLYGGNGYASQSVLRAFAHGEWRLSEAMLASFGGTWERDSLSGLSFSPRLMLNSRVAPGHTLRVGATRGHRMPTLYEERAREEFFDVATGILLDSTTRASGGLVPESIDSYEIGYLIDHPSRNVSLDIRAFDEHIKNAIVWFPRGLLTDCELFGATDPNTAFRPCGSSRDFANGARLHMRGVEYQAKWQPAESTRLTFNQSFIEIDAALTRNDIQDGTTGGFNYEAGITTHQTRSAPKRTDTLVLQQTLWRGLELFAAYSRVGTQKASLSAEAPAYERVDWKLAYRFRRQDVKGELAYTVQSDGARHAERFGNNSNPENNEWLYPRAWLSLRLEY